MDTRDSKIITMYKNNGERNNCNNYTGMSLICIVGKVFAGVMLVRLQKMAVRDTRSHNVASELKCQQ